MCGQKLAGERHPPRQIEVKRCTGQDVSVNTQGAKGRPSGIVWDDRADTEWAVRWSRLCVFACVLGTVCMWQKDNKLRQ